MTKNPGNLQELSSWQPVKTGINSLDNVLGGGLYPGLFILSAGPGAGKTALALQIADHIAGAGQNVLYFALDIGRLEMTCRSLARECYKLNPATAPSTGDILKGRLTPGQKALLEQVATTYGQAARHLTIQDAAFVNTEQIRQHLRQYIALKGSAPVVIIDYLQTLRPLDPRMTHNQTVTELKHISREVSAPVLAISSNDLDDVAADCLLSMQAGEQTEEQRGVKLQVLKNRTGSRGPDIDLTYWPAHNLFTK